jgi:hypothetical protein
MANDPKNIQLGPCRVRWGGLDLGLTKGGVEVEVTTDTKEVMVDQFGNTPVNEYITGRKLMVKCPFAETDLDTLHALMKDVGATLVDDGAKATGSITVTTNPAANDTLVVNGTTFTFKASAATGVRDVLIGTSQAATAANLLAVLQSSTDAKVTQAAYTMDAATPTVIAVTFLKTGTAGNSFTLVRTGTGITLSGATLTGGTASTRRRVDVATGIGVSIQQNSKELWLRPVSAADNDFSQDFVIPLAGTGGALTFAYKNDEERVFNLSFTGYPDAATGLLFRYGDKRSA